MLASDCDKFAFLSFPNPGDGASFTHPIVYAGDFGGLASSREINFNFPLGNNALSSVAISRGCTAAIVRVSPNFDPAAPERNAGDKLFVVKFNQDEKLGTSGKLGATSDYEIPASLRGLMLPSWPLLSPALAGAPMPGSNAMRVAWLTENGLAVVDLQEPAKVTPLVGSEGQVFLTGFTNFQGNTRMTISKDGNFLLMVSQKSFAVAPDFKIYDLRTEKRRDLLADSGRCAASPDSMSGVEFSASLRSVGRRRGSTGRCQFQSSDEPLRPELKAHRRAPTQTTSWGENGPDFTSTASGGEGYSTLAMNWRLWRAHPSFPRGQR